MRDMDTQVDDDETPEHLTLTKEPGRKHRAGLEKNAHISSRPDPVYVDGKHALTERKLHSYVDHADVDSGGPESLPSFDERVDHALQIHSTPAQAKALFGLYQEMMDDSHLHVDPHLQDVLQNALVDTVAREALRGDYLSEDAVIRTLQSNELRADSRYDAIREAVSKRTTELVDHRSAQHQQAVAPGINIETHSASQDGLLAVRMKEAGL